MRGILLVVSVALVASCTTSRTSSGRGDVARVSSGPIASSCLASGRKAANRQLCGCVQYVADLSLNASDARRAASFFGNPERAQQVRASDTAANDAFWARYTAFADRARKICNGV